MTEAGDVRVVLDEARCQGHGRCYALGPEVYGADDAGHCVILVPGSLASAVLAAQARRGAESCPERALTVEPA